MKLDEIEALFPKSTITEFDPSKKYLVIFEQGVSPVMMTVIRRAFELKGISACVLCGVPAPKVFEMKK